MGLAAEISQTQSVQTEFKISLPVELAISLAEWFSRSHKMGDLNSFANEVFQIPVAEYRLDSLPPGEVEVEARMTREKMNESRKEELFELVDEGEVNHAVLAERFGISRSSIRRLLIGRDAEMGIVREKKPRLTEQRRQEIWDLSRKGICISEIAGRFGLAKAYISYILRKQRSATI